MTEINAAERYAVTAANYEARNGQPRNEDLNIHVVAPADFPYHKWLAFSSEAQADIVKLLKKHKLVEEG